MHILNPGALLRFTIPSKFEILRDFSIGLGSTVSPKMAVSLAMITYDCMVSMSRNTLLILLWSCHDGLYTVGSHLKIWCIVPPTAKRYIENLNFPTTFGLSIGTHSFLTLSQLSPHHAHGRARSVAITCSHLLTYLIILHFLISELLHSLYSYYQSL